MPRNQEVRVLGKSLIFAPYGTKHCAVIDATYESLHFYCMKHSDLWFLSLLHTLWKRAMSQCMNEETEPLRSYVAILKSNLVKSEVKLKTHTDSFHFSCHCLLKMYSGNCLFFSEYQRNKCTYKQKSKQESIIYLRSPPRNDHYSAITWLSFLCI